MRLPLRLAAPADTGEGRLILWMCALAGSVALYWTAGPVIDHYLPPQQRLPAATSSVDPDDLPASPPAVVDDIGAALMLAPVQTKIVTRTVVPRTVVTEQASTGGQKVPVAPAPKLVAVAEAPERPVTVSAVAQAAVASKPPKPALPADPRLNLQVAALPSLPLPSLSLAPQRETTVPEPAARPDISTDAPPPFAALPPRIRPVPRPAGIIKAAAAPAADVSPTRIQPFETPVGASGQGPNIVGMFVTATDKWIIVLDGFGKLHRLAEGAVVSGQTISVIEPVRVMVTGQDGPYYLGIGQSIQTEAE